MGGVSAGDLLGAAATFVAVLLALELERWVRRREERRAFGQLVELAGMEAGRNQGALDLALQRPLAQAAREDLYAAGEIRTAALQRLADDQRAVAYLPIELRPTIVQLVSDLDELRVWLPRLSLAPTLADDTPVGPMLAQGVMQQAEVSRRMIRLELMPALRRLGRRYAPRRRLDWEAFARNRQRVLQIILDVEAGRPSVAPAGPASSRRRRLQSFLTRRRAGRWP
jgi:hypothetical protein